jgi:hypothetical protein
MNQAENDLLCRIERGESVFRPGEPGAGSQEAFARTVALLLELRTQGWIRLPDGRITRDSGDRVLVAGPCDLTEAGLRALEQDRRLGPRL